MGKKVLFILNPVAGRMKAKTELFDILNTFCRHGYDLSLQITQHRGHATELAAEAQKKGYDMVVCCGGDGTVRESVCGLLSAGSSLPLGYIPAGTTNDFGNTLGLPSNPLEAATRICREQPHIIDAGSFNKTFFSYVASFGAFTQVSYSVPQELKNAFGYMAYLVQALKSFTDIVPLPVSVTADGVPREGKYLFGCVSNANTVAGILHPDNININDGLFEVILVREVKNINDVNNIVLGAATSDFSSSSFEYFKAREILFEIDDAPPWSLDGERQPGDKTVRIENLKSALTIFG